MKSLMQRLLPGLFGRAQDRTQPAAPTATPAPPAQPPGNASSAAMDALLTVGARRPLISSAGKVAGFEFRIAEATLRRLKDSPDWRPKSAYVAATLASARLVVQTGRVGFARLPADWLAHASALGESPDTLVGIEEPAGSEDEQKVQGAVAQAAQRLRAGGARAGWPVVPEPAGKSADGPAPDFVLLRQGNAPMQALLDAARALPPEMRRLPMLATDIASVEDLEIALNGGVTYACGALSPSVAANTPKDLLPVPPEVRRIGHLMNLLLNDAELAAIAGAIKGDVGLSYRLLSRIGSASFAQLQPGASIEQAVMLLGRNELYRWLSVLLLQFAGRRKLSSALEEVALWRARLLELLAIEKREPAPGQLFTLGLASMLGIILKLDAADVVASLKLSEPGRQALVDQSGPWHSYLQIANQVEAQQLEATSALADQFGGGARVTELSDQAWAWAAQNMDWSATGKP